MTTSTARRFLKTVEQQVRLFPDVVKGKPVNRAFREVLRLPLVTMRRFKEVVEKTPVIVSDDFDRECGTETSARIYPADLNISGANWIHASPYFPTPSCLLREALEGIDLPFERLTFLDLGSGKGRVVLMASQLPFRRIIGIELSSELSEAAIRNLIAYRGPQQCHRIELGCQDFTDYRFPNEPLFVFLYNPASLHLSQVLARNLLRSIDQHPREVWILYVTPYEVFEDAKQLELMKSGECATHPYRLYRSLPSRS